MYGFLLDQSCVQPFAVCVSLKSAKCWPFNGNIALNNDLTTLIMYSASCLSPSGLHELQCMYMWGAVITRYCVGV